MAGSLIISVHDFSPKYHSQLEEILTELSSNGFSKRSLFVVPNYDNSFPLGKYYETLKRLVIESVNKNEICLHGYNHSRKFFYREFSHLDYGQAEDKLRKGRFELEKEGFNPSGFVPPFFKISIDAESAVRDRGFVFLVKNPGIKDLRSDNVFYSPHYGSGRIIFLWTMHSGFMTSSWLSCGILG